MNRRTTFQRIAWGISIGLICLHCSCRFSQPPAPASSKYPPTMVLKFVSYSQNDHLLGYFSLGDSRTNQVAWDGALRLRVQSAMGVNLFAEGGETPAVRVHRLLYDQTFPVSADRFHWERVGSFLRVEDLVFRFSVPYDHFKQPVSRGKPVRVQMDFVPRGVPQTLSTSKDIILY